MVAATLIGLIMVLAACAAEYEPPQHVDPAVVEAIATWVAAR